MALYFVSGVWKNNNNVITHMMVHPTDGANTFYAGKKMTELQVINLLAVNEILTIVWKYTVASFEGGDYLTVVGTGSNRYVRSHRNGTVTDNLDNLIDYAAIA